MSEDLAGKMAELTISSTEDEATEAQAAMHKLRVDKAVIAEQKQLLQAEIRRLEFALSELDKD